MNIDDLRKIAEEARQASVRPALWEPYRLYNALADGIEELLDHVETAEQALQRARALAEAYDQQPEERELCGAVAQGIRASLEGDE